MKQDYLGIWNLLLQEEGSVLNHFHLRMSRGDFVELLGTEGSGKEDLACFFAGIRHIGEGYVKIGTRKYYPGESLREAELQYLGELPSLAGELSVAENILLLSKNRMIRGIISHRDLETRVNFLLSEFGINFREGVPVSRLTEGEKRVVEIMRAAASEIPLIVIDNIFESLGQEDIQMIGSCLTELKRRGTTILVLGGRFPLFRDLDDRVIVIRAGENVRTFFGGNFDRATFVRWVFDVSQPTDARIGALGNLKRRNPVRTDAGSETALTVSDLDGEYLKAFSCKIRKSEIVGFYDMNNRQNRELIRYLAGKERIPGGKAVLNGRNYKPRSVHEAVRLGIAYIPENLMESAVVESMSYGENLTLPVMKKNSTLGIFVNRRIRKYLEREYGKELDAGLSGPSTAEALDTSDRMRVVLQRILLLRPSLLLIEGVLSDMNVQMLEMQTDYLVRLTDAGCAIAISSQNLMLLRQICDRIIVMGEPDPQEGGHFHEIATERSKNSPPIRKLP